MTEEELYERELRFKEESYLPYDNLIEPYNKMKDESFIEDFEYVFLQKMRQARDEICEEMGITLDEFRELEDLTGVHERIDIDD